MDIEALDTIKEGAKAVKAVAETGGKAVDAASGVGAFLKKIFGDIIEDSAGLLGDSLRAYRLKRLAVLQEMTNEFLAAKGVQATQPLSPRIAYRILQEGTLEEDADLSSRFARLLAEALDPKGEAITIEHSGVLSELRPETVILLDYCWKNKNRVGHATRPITYQEVPIDNAVRSLSEVATAIDAKQSAVRQALTLGLIMPESKEYTVLSASTHTLGDAQPARPLEKVSIYHDIEWFRFTEFGISFCKAVIAPI